uniref:BPTI/Kunitz inhibitor domain-containing protein n=1 Tax=Caenorhabditis japonica TaxID=281687 RepID=A0A8R1IA83_CAEJA
MCCGLAIADICPTGVYPAIKVKKCSMCAAGYECHKNYCCPQKEVACAQPVPSDEPTVDGEGGVVRYYYDSETNTCHSFNYQSSRRPPTLSTAQNHFANHESCIETCVQNPIMDMELQCPHPYVNPIDHPQMCIATSTLKSCSNDESCLKTKSGALVCCQHPPSFNILMSNLCGPNYAPTLNRSGNP